MHDWSEVRAEGSRSRSLFQNGHRVRVCSGRRIGRRRPVQGMRGGASPIGVGIAQRLRRAEARPRERARRPRRRRRFSRKWALPPADWRCFFPGKGPSTSACCASWLAGFPGCRRPWPGRMMFTTNTRSASRIGSIRQLLTMMRLARHTNLTLRDTRYRTAGDWGSQSGAAANSGRFRGAP